MPDVHVEIPAVVPEVDVSQHSVPLEEIYFDTFRPVNRAVPLSQAAPELIHQLRDAIPPIHDPKYETVVEANWLEEGDAVIGYAVGDQAWAYPIRILNFHEIVNDTLDGEPLVITFCPLCYSGIVFSRRLGDEILTFGNTSALYESDMVMLDYQTGSYWWQVAGQAIVGPLTEKTLTVLPSMTTTWGEWQRLYPETLILSRDTGFQRDYDRDPFVDYAEVVNTGRFAFPVSEAGQGTAIMDTVGDQDVVIFADPSGPTGAAYQPVAGEQTLTFEVQDGEFTDLETGSTWDLAGRASSGPLAGTQLLAVPSKTTFWFAIIAAEPEITVYQEGAG
jgi:hypothetical protein